MNAKFKLGEKIFDYGRICTIKAIIIRENCIEYEVWYTIKNVDFYDIVEENKLKKYKPILDNTEKRYLENVIRPFKDKIKYLVKSKTPNGEYIGFDLNNHDNFGLPNFKKKTMYIGMRSEKKYTLKELGLFEEDK